MELLASKAVSLIVAAKPWPDRDGYDLTAFTAREVCEIVERLQGIEALEDCLDDFSLLMVPSHADAVELVLPPLNEAEATALDMTAFAGERARLPPG